MRGCWTAAREAPHGDVLSIGKLTAGQAGYYEQQVALGRDDYYSGEGEAPGEWQGSGAAELGLGGTVTSTAFQATVIAHRDPRTDEELRHPPARTRVLAYDLTFSAPKSVSVLFAIADTDTSRALRAAHDEAVAEARTYLEREAGYVRRGHGGSERLPAEGFVSAAYRHRMSRAQDPQLHTHVVTANVARGRDGRWSALDGYALYQHAKAAGYVYEAHLRCAVRERLPWVRWSSVEKGIAEIEGVPEAVRREFSTRRAEIEEWLKREGRSGRRAAEKAALATREPKRGAVNGASWRDGIRARAAEHGLGRAELEELARGRARTREAVDHDGVGLRLVGRHGPTATRNTFATRHAAIEWAAAHRDGARADEVEAATARFLERPR